MVKMPSIWESEAEKEAAYRSLSEEKKLFHDEDKSIETSAYARSNEIKIYQTTDNSYYYENIF